MDSSETFIIERWHLQKVLRELIMEVSSPLRDDIERSLAERGKLLYRPEADVDSAVSLQFSGVCSLLPLLIARYTRPSIDLLYASKVAIAVECFICALDLLDDVEDEDQTPVVLELGVARALNVATALLALAQRAILSLASLDISAPVAGLLSMMQEDLLTATAAQHRDLLAEGRRVDELTPEECIEIAAGKAGALLRLACRLGALAAGADEEVIAQYAQFGELYGISQQLDNDCHDLYYLLQDTISGIAGTQLAKKSGKTDLIRGKKTLPIVLAMRQRFSEGEKLVHEQGKQDEQYLLSLKKSILVAWGFCLFYQERASECLQRIEMTHALKSPLRQLLRLT